MNPLVQLEGVDHRYGHQWALRDIDFSVEAGELFGVVGADGAGKTTLLQICAAILDPTAGRCDVLGFDSVTGAKAITARIGYMSQGFTLYDRLTVAENLRFAARIRSVGDEVYGERSRRLLNMAGLGGFMNRSAGVLSGGMRKKLSLCTNLIHEPDLLILDEPGLGVDPLSRRELWTILETFRQQGMTILVATSYMDEAERCNRVLLLQHGSILAVDEPEGVRGKARGKVFEYTTTDPTLIAGKLARYSGLYGIQVLPDRVRFQRGEAKTADAAFEFPGDFREVEPTLEDVFVLHAGRTGNTAPPMAQMAPLPHRGGIKAEEVTIRFGDFTAVDHVSFEARPGMLLALIGPNGAGKTTLIRSLCGLLQISDGAAWIGDDRVLPETHQLRQQIGYMSQRFSLYKDMTPGENLAFFASAYGLEGPAAEEAIRRACEMTQLEYHGDEIPVASMSGATRQRLALACSILHRPTVLFLDEPTSGIDPVARYRFWELIRLLAGAGMVVIVTTHYLDEAAYCDSIGLMQQGHLIDFGSLAELRADRGMSADAPVEEVFINAIRQTGFTR